MRANFIGGPAAGHVVYMEDAPWEYRVPVMKPLRVLASLDSAAVVDLDVAVYTRVRSSSDNIVYYIYERTTSL